MSSSNKKPPANSPPEDKPGYAWDDVGFGPEVGNERFWELQDSTEAPPPTTSRQGAQARRHDVKLEGRRWGAQEAYSRHDELPDRIEMVRGRLFLSEDDRLKVLAALLEHVGAAKAVRIGDPEVWKAAVRALDDQADHCSV